MGPVNTRATSCRAIALAAAIASAIVAGCTGGGGGGGGGGASASGSGASAAPAVTSGVLSVLCYNVAGLPAGLSASQPQIYMTQISPLLNAYGLVLVQEDFWYHRELSSLALHAHQSRPQTGHVAPMDDGLNMFSDWPFDPLVRTTWVDCHGVQSNGSDCLAAKGFTFTTLRPAPGIEIDVYNHHADAGSAARDDAARATQFRQLADFIALRSAGRPVIVAGDMNLAGHDKIDEPVIQAFLTSTGLACVCRAVSCGDERRIDRIMIRDGASVFLRPITWRIASEFVDPSGANLSDHKAVHAVVEWTTTP